MWILKEGEEFIFRHPFRCYIAGPTCCGKTNLIKKILLNLNNLVDKRIDKIVVCYKVMQEAYEIFKYLPMEVEFVEGLIDSRTFESSKNNLLILDDLMEVCKDSKEIVNLFSVDSHHRNVSVFLVSQNIFSKGKCTRDLTLNSSNMIIFKNPRDNVQISVLARQIFPGKTKAFMEAFKDATTKKHGYLFLDFSQTISENMRIQTDIVDERRIIYTFN